MAELLSPGVYVIEESSGMKPIEGVGTSTAAFIGIAERGPVDQPVLVTSYTDYVNIFGGFIDGVYLSMAVYQFFQEQGRRCFIVRTVQHDENGIKKSAAAVPDSTPAFTLISLEAKWDGSWANSEKVSNVIKPGSGLEVDFREATLLSKSDGYFRLDVYYKSKSPKSGETTGERILVETFDDLTTATAVDKINSASKYININEITETSDLSSIGNVTLQFVDGKDGIHDTNNKISLKTTDFIGNRAAASSGAYGLNAFDVIDEINNIAIPDASLATGDTEGADTKKALDKAMSEIIKNGMNYCESRGDCFYIADPPNGLPVTNTSTPKGVKEFKSEFGINSTYGALYYPWLYVNHPITGKRMSMPASGGVAGIYARSDSTVGVHKAPAGHGIGKLDSATGVFRLVNSGEHDMLNPNGINVIRAFPNEGIVVWGARTVSTDPEWRYVNVRRLFLFVEESVEQGTQWVVFEPNTPSLWGTIKRNLTNFLTNLWRSGALFGNTPEEAFYVKVDEENNPPSERDAGRLNIEIGIAPVKPAEFVIIRISQKTLLK